MLEDGPRIALIVGFIFIVLATVALTGEKLGEAIPKASVSVTNDQLTGVTEAGVKVPQANGAGFSAFSLTEARNSSGTVIGSGNYTTSADGTVAFAGTETVFNNTNWFVDYSYEFNNVAINVTNDLNTEIANNTSIVGIVLTISLIGIVLGVLIGVFALSGRTRRA